MNVQQILSDLHQQRNRIDQAIAVLEGLGGQAKRRGRPPKNVGSSSAPIRKRRRMSAAARKRIGEAKRKWWAQQKKQGK
jgi:hypothetical protein